MNLHGFYIEHSLGWLLLQGKSLKEATSLISLKFKKCNIKKLDSVEFEIKLHQIPMKTGSPRPKHVSFCLVTVNDEHAKPRFKIKFRGYI